MLYFSPDVQIVNIAFFSIIFVLLFLTGNSAKQVGNESEILQVNFDMVNISKIELAICRIILHSHHSIIDRLYVMCRFFS